MFNVAFSIVINFETVSLHSLRWPPSCTFSAPASQVLGSQACSSTLNSVIHSSEFWCWDVLVKKSHSPGLRVIAFCLGEDRGMITMFNTWWCQHKKELINRGQLCYINYLDTGSDCNLSYARTYYRAQLALDSGSSRLYFPSAGITCVLLSLVAQRKKVIKEDHVGFVICA